MLRNFGVAEIPADVGIRLQGGRSINAAEFTPATRPCPSPSAALQGGRSINAAEFVAAQSEAYGKIELQGGRSINAAEFAIGELIGLLLSDGFNEAAALMLRNFTALDYVHDVFNLASMRPQH